MAERKVMNFSFFVKSLVLKVLQAAIKANGLLNVSCQKKIGEQTTAKYYSSLNSPVVSNLRKYRTNIIGKAWLHFYTISFDIEFYLLSL